VSKTQEAHAPTAEFLDEEGNLKIKPGDKITAFVTALSEGIVLSTRLAKDQIDVGMLEAAREAQIPVQGTVAAVNKGGAEITLAGAARGFCPLAQLDINYVEDPAQFVGKTFDFLVREVRENGKNVVLSRRSLLEKQRKEKGDKLLATLEVGAVVDGVVTRIQPFGAFVDLGGVDGLVPVFELSFSHVKDPSDVVTLGQTVRVEVKRIEEDPKRQGQMRISLSLKSTLADPFVEHAAELHRGQVLEGTVKKLESFGAFVELFPGVQGLVHVSQIADRRIAHPREVLKVDEVVRVIVVDFDPSTRRVSLTMREGSDALLSDDQKHDKREAHRTRTGRGASVQGVVDRIESYGVFVKLDPVDGKDLGSALMPASETGTPRGTDLRKALPLGTRVEALVIEVDERGRLKISRTAREQAEERALVAQYNTSNQKGGGGGGLGTFADLLKAKLAK
jgi:small subunit ribosomal protein S1